MIEILFWVVSIVSGLAAIGVIRIIMMNEEEMVDSIFGGEGRKMNQKDMVEVIRQAIDGTKYYEEVGESEFLGLVVGALDVVKEGYEMRLEEVEAEEDDEVQLI